MDFKIKLKFFKRPLYQSTKIIVISVCAGFLKASIKIDGQDGSGLQFEKF